jgi:putative selenium metabolism protein SsnA
MILSGGTVVTGLTPARLSLADVVVEGTRIEALGRGSPGGPERDCSGCLIVPGNVCAHTHLYSALARGMPYSLEPPRNFHQILQRIWWRLDRALDGDTIRASALAAATEALLSGTTTVVDHHASPASIEGSLNLIADALEEVGLRSILCYEVSDRDGPERARAGIEENRRFLRSARPLARGMVGAHASFTLSEETLDECAALARDTGSGIHVHVAEDEVDQRDSLARFGKPVVERLADAGVLGERGVAAHCVHLHPSEIELLRESRTTIAHNPRSNMNNGVGTAPAYGLGEAVALGTDGIGTDMFDESRIAFWRAREEDVLVSPSWPLERLARGAAFAGACFGEPALGAIESGAPADLVVLEYSEPTPLTDANLPGHWLFGLHAGLVRDVMVNGEMVVQDRRPTGVDHEKIAAEARAAAERLWGRLEEIEPHSFEPMGGR